jgi:lactoylglutathione lyase
MKIEHIAIWVKDIDKVCEFYHKYFGGVVQPLYHNPAKQFTSRFVTFDDSARLEIMHRPDVERNVGIEEIVSRETQPRFPSKNGLAHFYLETAGCRPMAKPEAQHFGFTHLSFSVGSKEKVDSLTHQMSTEGVPVVGQPRTTGDGYYESVVLDPEGNRIEITV